MLCECTHFDMNVILENEMKMKEKEKSTRLKVQDMTYVSPLPIPGRIDRYCPIFYKVWSTIMMLLRFEFNIFSRMHCNKL